jgi:glycosyltransferase involved in cell wall biosynthesis
LTIVGDGPQRDALEAQAHALGARCLFAGHLQGAALWTQVEAATVVALPSLWYENAPKSVLEALARRKPVVTTRIGGLPEMVEHEENGLLVEPGNRSSLADALRRVLAMDEGSLAAMGAKGREYATTHFTRDRYYREMTAVYAEIVPGLKEAAE